MDGKGSRGLSGVDRQRRQKVVKFGQKAIKNLVVHKQSLLASILLLILVALLFGIFSQFQPPTVSTAPGGETPIDYGSFVAQVKAGNVLAVTIRGNDLNGLLIRPLTQGQSMPAGEPTLTSSQRAADFAAFSRYIGAGANWAGTSAGPAIDPARLVYTRFPDSGDAALMSLLVSHHVMVNTLPPSQPPLWLSLIWRIAPFLLLALVLAVILVPRTHARSTRGIDERVNGIGKSNARRYERAKQVHEPRRPPEKPAMVGRNGTSSTARKRLEPAVTFADVAGIDEVRAELEEMVQFLRDPQRYERLGARIPRGALLVGPPGTGKTLLAKAVAGEAGVPFFSMSASEFVEMFVGVGASRVRDLFNQARQAAPCVVFIDELDAVGRKRTTKLIGNDERDQTLNQLLVELDGFTGRQAVVVLAATNRVDILDKALLRPGRFDRHITVSLPDRRGREAILRVHTRQVPLDGDVSLERISRLTTGMSGADLANLVNEAALGAARRNLEQVTHECFEEALARVQLGALRPLVMIEAERRIIAYHEGGHALVAHHLPEADRVNRVTILPRGQSLGVTQFTPEEDRYNYSRQMLMARIAVGLGGRAAEELTFGPEHVTTGAENDLQVVTELARNMVTRWGMSEQVGVVFADYHSEVAGVGLNMSRIDQDDLPAQKWALVVDAGGGLVLNERDLPAQHAFAMAAPPAGKPSSTNMANMIDREVQRIINDGYEIARTLLKEHYDQLTRLAEALMEYEQLDRKQFEALLTE